MKSLLRWMMGLAIFLGAVAPGFAGSEFNYQGQVSVDGVPFNGTGQFKLAIVNENKDSTHWSNDGTSVNAQAPTAYLTAPVTDGIFNIIVGDKSKMDVIPAHIFNTGQEIFLRVWFSDGTHGFELLQPDRRITNVEILGQISGEEDVTVYVNVATGNDKHSGLDDKHPKKTIQAAVNMAPRLMRANTTIRIAPGIYREQVNIFGLSVDPGKRLTLIGDADWVTTSAGNPSVRITGCDDDATRARVRNAAIFIEQCSRVRIQGFFVDYTQLSAIRINGSTAVEIDRCKADHCVAAYASDEGEAPGSVLYYQSSGKISRMIADYSGGHGIKWASSIGYQDGTITRHNTYDGVKATGNSTLTFDGRIESSYNHDSGLSGILNTDLHFTPYTYSGTYANNGTAGILASFNSLLTGANKHTITGSPSAVDISNGSGDYTSTYY